MPPPYLKDITVLMEVDRNSDHVSTSEGKYHILIYFYLQKGCVSPPIPPISTLIYGLMGKRNKGNSEETWLIHHYCTSC